MKTYYFAFEIQGQEQLVVQIVTDAGEEAARAMAIETYLGDRVDCYCVEPENVHRYDCPIVDCNGEALDYCECIDDDNQNIEEEEN